MAEGSPLAQAYHAYEQVEGQVSAALDALVATNGFADLLATSATNLMALTRMVNGGVDRAVRSTRLAARQDVTELARQLARTEDKLERLLQAVQELQSRLDEPARPADPPAAAEPEPAPVRAPAVNGTARRPRTTAGTARRTTSGAP